MVDVVKGPKVAFQVAADGLLQSLRIKGGQGPYAMDLCVAPSLEVGEFYGAAQMRGSTSAPTVGALAPELVESLTFTNVLGLKGIGATLTIGAAAGANVVVSVAYQPRVGDTVVTLASQVFPVAAIGQRCRVGVVLPAWVAPAGAVVFATASGTAAGADHSLQVEALIQNYREDG